ncbi:MAG: long-chain fatty acid--CoA ligase [Gemmatimonadetes bacterium]|nr:long-chain fatty acid--CoA ligase [Gemmatimonadota bacterium]
MATTIADILPQAARKHGDRVALIVNGQRWSFRELDVLSNYVANGLVASGVSPGDRVGLFGPNCWEWLVSYYGIAKAGAVVNPLSSMLTADEVRYAVGDTGARAVIASSDKAQLLQELKAGGARFELVVWDEAPVAGATRLRDWLTHASSEFVARPRLPSDLAAICYTSGTTGRPKGAMQSQRAVMGAAVGTALMAARTAEDRVISALPLFHVYGSCVMNAAMVAGSTLIVIPRFNEVVVLSAIAEHRATIMDGVPTAYYYLLAHPDFDQYDLSSLTRCWVGGQTLPAAKSNEFTRRTGCPVHEVWGMTELAGAVSANPVYGPNKPGTIGVPYPGNAFRVVDVEDPDKDMAPGERGELMYRGPLVMMGYYNNPEATAETIRPDGWLHTGDIATMDDDGFATIVDRKKDMILTAGFNVYPAEIERVLCMHPAVALAAVGSIPDEAKGELAEAYLMRKPGVEVSRAALVAHCREHLAAYKVPRGIQFVDSVPMTSSGKIMRRLLREIDDGSLSIE